MSEWLDFVKAYATKHNISYKQALRDASPTYKTRKEIKPEAALGMRFDCVSHSSGLQSSHCQATTGPSISLLSCFKIVVTPTTIFIINFGYFSFFSITQ